MTAGHPWKELERQLQQIRELVLAGEKPGSRVLIELIAEIKPFVKCAASRILKSPQLRRFQRSADDAWQQWWANMLAVGFYKYDPARGPLFPYAYTTLSNACTQGTRGKRGKLPCPLIENAIADQSKPLKRLGIKETWGMPLYEAVRELPFNYRRAMLLKYWFEKKPNEVAKRCNVCIATYNTWVFQGHRLLKEKFEGRSWPDVA